MGRLPHFQVNKFDMENVDPLALQCLEEWRWNRTRKEEEEEEKDDAWWSRNENDVNWNYYAMIKRIVTKEQRGCVTTFSNNSAICAFKRIHVIFAICVEVLFVYLRF